MSKTTRPITPEGYRVLKEELTFLWKVKRPEVTRRVSEAAAMGDRSENAEYIYGKRQLRQIDSRVRYLSKRLDLLAVVDRLPPDQHKVYFGAWLEVEDGEGQQHRYRVVGSDEFDAAKGYISIDSPLAQALLRHGVGDAIEVSTPEGAAHYAITRIWYQPAGPAGAS